MRERISHRDHRVAEDRQIGTAAQLFNRIARVRITYSELRGRGRSQMAARGKSHNPYAVRINLPFGGFRPRVANRPQRVLNHRRVLIFRPQAIFQNNRCDADAVEPYGDVMPFVGRKPRVTAAGTNDDRRAGGLVGGRSIELYARDVFGLIALCARRATCPEWNWRRSTRSLCRGLIRILSERGGDDADWNQEQCGFYRYKFHHSASVLKL